MKVGKFLTLIAVLAMATSAMATSVTIATGTYFRLEAVNAAVVEGTVANGLVAFTLRAVNISGNTINNPQGVDAAGTFAGITGQIHQNMLTTTIPTKTSSKTPSLDAWLGEDPADVAIDSHWLVYSEDIAAVVAPTENGTSASPWASPNYFSRWGTYLQARYGILGANTSSQLDLAYVVVPCCSSVNLHMQVGGVTGNKETFNLAWDTENAVQCIPTPAALPLGLVGLLLVRRRS